MLTTIDNILSTDELKRTHKLLTDGTWHSGKSSAGAYVQDIKTNEEMDQTCAAWKQINELVVGNLYQHPEFQNAALPHRVSAAFVARYTGSMTYGPHVDDAVMGPPTSRYRSDIAVTVYLTEPDTYTGGELAIHTRYGKHEVKLPAGSAVVYPASSLHEVQPVTEGQRIVCVLWAQSLVKEPERREILAELAEARSALHQTVPQAKVTASVDHAYMNLLRMWSEV